MVVAGTAGCGVAGEGAGSAEVSRDDNAYVIATTAG
jgi:hypothetical protein